VIGIVTIGVLLLSGSALAAQYQDSVWAYEDTCVCSWVGSVADYDEQHEANDADYASSLTAYALETVYFTDPDWDTAGQIDSIATVIRAQATGTTGTAQISAYWTYGPASECAGALYGSDTLTLTADWQNLRVVHSQSEFGDPLRDWWWIEMYFSAVAYTFTFENLTMLSKGQNRVSWVCRVIYWTTEEPTGQIINIGRNDEATHNPRLSRGVLDSRW